MRTRLDTKPLRIAALLMLAAFAHAGFAQQPAPAVTAQMPAKPLDNYTIQRLIVTNDKGEILLEKNAFGWMTPALRSSKRESVKEALNGLASELGLRVEAIQLAGLYTYQFDETPPNPEHAAISFRSHYTAKYVSGEVVPPKDGKEYQWVARGEVAKRIGMDSLRTETMQILEHPDTLWGGSFLITFKGDKLESSRPLEAPYPLRAH